MFRRHDSDRHDAPLADRLSAAAADAAEGVADRARRPPPVLDAALAVTAVTALFAAAALSAAAALALAAVVGGPLAGAAAVALALAAVLVALPLAAVRVAAAAAERALAA
ncbi:hypothetical protein [Halostella litorea]|uniref:hypothetical protein n=1 Tax=Halostella litorea TaxID=2528831 RepID=UPI001091ACB8|nr:hypothetical protein [Halostella litorea]